MTTALRPMSTGELLDRMFQMYRSHFVLFFGIATVPAALLLGAQLVIAVAMGAGTAGAEGGAGATAAGEAPGVGALFSGFALAAVAGVVVLVIAYLVGMAVAQAATVYAVSAVHLGRPITITESFGRVRGRYLRVLLVILMVMLIVFGISVLFMIGMITVGTLLGAVLAAAGGVAGAIVGGILGFGAVVLGLVLMVWLFARYALAIPACVLEDLKVMASLRRSEVLTRGSIVRVVTVYFIVVMFSWIVSIALLVPLSLIPGDNNAALWFQALSYVVSFLSGALVGPIATIAMALLYYDERVRKEAFDLEHMMATLDGSAPGPQIATAGSA